MPLFEVETTSHIMIACAADEQAARAFAVSNYPVEDIIRVAHRPRDAWVISKKLLGIQVEGDPCTIARDCLSRAQGDKLHAMRLYMKSTGSDLDGGAQGDRVEYDSRVVMRRLADFGRAGRKPWSPPGCKSEGGVVRAGATITTTVSVTGARAIAGRLRAKNTIN